MTPAPDRLQRLQHWMLDALIAPGGVDEAAIAAAVLPGPKLSASGCLAIYQRSYIESARRFPEVPALSPEQVEALDLFDQLSDDPTLHLRMELRAGDIQLVHNHSLLHDRTAFEDWPEPERRRHLLRLWLAPEQARPLPPIFAERYGSVVPGDRGGVQVPGSHFTVAWEPEDSLPVG